MIIVPMVETLSTIRILRNLHTWIPEFLHLHPGGMRDSSRGLSPLRRTIPPDQGEKRIAPWRGARIIRSNNHSTATVTCWAYRCISSFWHPSRVQIKFLRSSLDIPCWILDIQIDFFECLEYNVTHLGGALLPTHFKKEPIFCSKFLLNKILLSGLSVVSPRQDWAVTAFPTYFGD